MKNVLMITSPRDHLFADELHRKVSSVIAERYSKNEVALENQERISTRYVCSYDGFIEALSGKYDFAIFSELAVPRRETHTLPSLLNGLDMIRETRNRKLPTLILLDRQEMLLPEIVALNRLTKIEVPVSMVLDHFADYLLSKRPDKFVAIEVREPDWKRRL